jgi:hypothetical protein
VSVRLAVSIRIDKCSSLLLVLLLLPVWSVRLGLAQVRSGTILGKVVDPGGAPVPDAVVKIIEAETNSLSDTVTNAVGDYSFPYLAAGRYTVTVIKQGFTVAKETGIEVETATTVRADIKLELGTVAKTVEVSATLAELQTESAAVQHAIAEKTIQSIPNIAQNPFYYAELQPGVVARATTNDSQSVRAFGVGQDARRQYSSVSINGGMTFMNDVQIDGISMIGATFNEPNVIPNPDGVQEVRTIVNDYSAEYGRGQGVISVTTKSGTNEFHGTASYRLRNEALNANSFGNNQQAVARPAFKVNTYGGTIGGPIKKDRAFFFVSYEGLKHSQGLVYLETVPTALERVGDFSKTLVNTGGTPAPQMLFDTFNVTQLASNVYQRAPIPNAIIPNPNPYAMKMFSYYPLPNHTPIDVYNTNNYYYDGQQNFNRNSVNSRIDYRWRKHSFYGSGGLFQGNVNAVGPWGPSSIFVGGLNSNSGGQGTIVSDKNPYASLGDIVVLSPTLVLDLRYGITRMNTVNQLPVTPNLDYNQFGIPRQIEAISVNPGTPPWDGWGGPWSLLQIQSPHNQQYATTHALVSSLTKTVNRWTFKSGGEYRVYLSNFFSTKGGIQYVSSNSYTNQMISAAGGGIGSPPANQAGIGAGSLLLGAGDLSVPSAPGASILGESDGLYAPAFAQKYGALFTQADWHATSRLTVNLGLRWDVQPGATDRFNNISGFNINGTNPYSGQGAIVFPGVDGRPRNIYNTQWHDFGPRSGLAYRLTDTMVVRAGYGLTYLPSNTGFRASPLYWGGDSFDPFVNNVIYGSNPTGVPIGQFNSLQVNQLVPATGSNQNAPSLYGGNSNTKFATLFQTQRVQQWNLFVEKRAGSDWLFSAGYSASKGSHLIVSGMAYTNSTLLPRALLASWQQGYIQSNGTNDPGTQQVRNPYQPASGPLIPFTGDYGLATVSQLEAALPLGLFSGVGGNQSVGWSNYNALILTAQHRFGKGLILNASFTWSKAEDFTNSGTSNSDFYDSGTGPGGINLTNLRASYGPSYFDVPRRFVLSAVYELPFGAGKPFNPGNPVLKTIVGGWRVAPVWVAQSGIPVQITGASTGSLNAKPNRVAGEPFEVPKDLQHWYNGKTTVTLPDGRKITPCANCYLIYNPDAFAGSVVTTPSGATVPNVYWFGNAANTYEGIRTPIINNWNLSLARTFRPKEWITLDFAAQATNAFNHTQFRPDVNGALGATSVAVNSPLNIQPGQGQSSTFGSIGNTTYDPRQIELQLKIRF